VKILSKVDYKMPSGEMKRVEEYSDYNTEDFTEEEKIKMNEMLKIKKEGKKNDPMTIPPDIDNLLRELHSKGGIRLDNSQEINLIRDLIHQSKYNDELKLSMYKLMELMINFANLWIIHYNKHS